MTKRHLDNRSEERFAKALDTRMKELGLSIRDVARLANVTYEHIRKLVRGLAYPSPWLVQQLADLLNLDKNELNKLAVADRIESKFGTTAAILGGKDPESLHVMKRYKLLTYEQRILVIATMDGFISQDAATNKSQPNPSALLGF